jgi:hypothetical protein
MHSKTTCAFQAEDTIHLPPYADTPVPNCKLAPPWHDGDAVAMKPLIKLERETLRFSFHVLTLERDCWRSFCKEEHCNPGTRSCWFLGKAGYQLVLSV